MYYSMIKLEDNIAFLGSTMIVHGSAVGEVQVVAFLLLTLFIQWLNSFHWLIWLRMFYLAL